MKLNKYKITFSKTYIVNSKTEQDAKEQAMIVWETKEHPVNIIVSTEKNGKKKK
jgi:hypothetical protein